MNTNSSRSRLPPELDMTPDGRFHEPPPSPLMTQVVRWAVVVAVVAGGLALAAVALWFALLLVPVAIIAALVAYAANRFQFWRAGRSVPGGRRPVTWRRHRYYE